MAQFEEVYAEFFPLICRYTYSLCRSEALAQDLAQEAFLKAMKGIGGFRGECKLEVWLCQIARNTYFTYLKKQERAQKSLEALPLEPCADAAPEENREAAMEVHRALHRLEEPYKEVFSLRAFGELSFAQVAELFGKTESWARVTYYRARLKIKTMMEETE